MLSKCYVKYKHKGLPGKVDLPGSQPCLELYTMKASSQPKMKTGVANLRTGSRAALRPLFMYNFR